MRLVDGVNELGVAQIDRHMGQARLIRVLEKQQVASLERTIPDKATRVLIYCNNNFRDAEGPFPTKLPAASLNLSTYIALYTYGYRNVYELGPQIDPKRSKLPLEPTAPKP